MTARILLQKIIKYFTIALAAFIILLAVLIDIARFSIPLFHHKTAYFTEWASQVLHQPVKISRVRMSWLGLNPALKFSDVEIQSANQKHVLLYIHHLIISIDLLPSLLHRELLPDRLLIDGATVTVRLTPEGRWNVQGIISGNPNDLDAVSLENIQNIGSWLLTQANVYLNHITILYHPTATTTTSVHQLKLNIINNLFEHQINGSASVQQGESLPNSKIKFILKISQPLVTPDADLYVDGENLVFSQWLPAKFLQSYLPHCSLSGISNVKLWGKWKSGQVTYWHALLNGKNLATICQSQASSLTPQLFINLKSFSANTLWEKTQEGWNWSADQIRLCDASNCLPEHHVGLRAFTDKVGTLKEILLVCDAWRWQDILSKFNLNELTILSPAQKKLYQDLDFKGDFFATKLLYQFPQLQQPASFLLETQFSDISFLPQMSFPGMKNLRGKLWLTPYSGKIILNSKAASLNMPALFSSPFNLKMQGKVNWSNINNRLTIRGKNLKIDDHNIALNTNFNLQETSSNQFLLKALGKLTAKNTGEIQRYLPRTYLSPFLYNWLKNAFPQGQVSQATFLFQGPLSVFPFDQREGHFEIVATVKDVTLLYSPHWPAIHHLNGTLTFNNRGLLIRADQGETMGNPLDNMQAEIKNLQQANIEITGHSATNLASALTFLLTTPLELKQELSRLSANGPVNLNLKLFFPYHFFLHKPPTVGVDITGELQNAVVEIPSWNVNVEKLQGSFQIKDQNFFSNNIQAEYAGLPLTLSFTTKPEKGIEKTYLNIHAIGKIDFKDLQNRWQNPWLQYFQGEVNYQLDLQLHHLESPIQNQLRLSSNLQGLNIDLPAPFGKTPQEIKTLSFNFHTIPNTPHLILRMNYNEALSLTGQVDKKSEGFHFISTIIQLGKPRFLEPESSGLWIVGYLKQLDWVTWQDFFKKNSQKLSLNDKKSILPLLKKIDIRIGELKTADGNFSAIQLNILPRKTRWMVSVTSPLVAGSLSIPNDQHQLWVGEFSYIRWPAMQHDSTDHFDPRELPALDIRCNEFQYEGKMLGRFQLITRKIPNGLAIQSLRVVSPTSYADIKGRWLQSGKEAKTQVSGNVNITDLGKLLQAWNLGGVISGGRGNVLFNLDWQGSPFQVNKSSLNGGFTVDFAQGRIIKVTESAEAELGLGRFLNLFSLQFTSLPLNFSDLAKKGFPFTKLKAQFKLWKGNLYAPDANLAGPLAWVKLQGRVGLAARDYDIYLYVDPNISSTFPLIAGLIGGPIAGGITWLVNKIMAPHIGKAVQTTYHLTGSWDRPVIVKIPSHQQRVR